MVITAVVHRLIHMDRGAGLAVCYAVVVGTTLPETVVLLIATSTTRRTASAL
jgi:hypothetical protein